MNTMNMPGFGPEASLGETSEHYELNVGQSNVDGRCIIHPQRKRLGDINGEPRESSGGGGRGQPMVCYLFPATGNAIC